MQSTTGGVVPRAHVGKAEPSLLVRPSGKRSARATAKLTAPHTLWGRRWVITRCWLLGVLHSGGCWSWTRWRWSGDIRRQHSHSTVSISANNFNNKTHYYSLIFIWWKYFSCIYYYLYDKCIYIENMYLLIVSFIIWLIIKINMNEFGIINEWSLLCINML
jgi:hypothetical protein